MIRSTFAGFTAAQLAMSASQMALNVCGQNIANINTRGYTRQRVDLVSLNLHNSSPYNSGTRIGYGVETTGISQIRDSFLDIQYRNQIAKVGTTDSRQAILDELGDIFDETDKNAVKTTISQITTALSKMSKNVTYGDNSLRSAFQSLLSIIHQKTEDLSTVRDENIYGLENTDIPNVNNILSDIGELNDKIWDCEIRGDAALELKDQRNTKLDELASYLPITVTYNSVEVGSGVTCEYPSVKFKGSNGISYNLISGEHGENHGSLSVERNLDYDGNEDGTVSLSLTPASDYDADADMSSLKTDITSYITNGTLKGQLDMLNKSGQLDDPPTDYRGIGYYEKALDSFVNTLAETFNEFTAPYTGVSSMPLSGAAVKIKNPTGTEHAEYNYDFNDCSGNFLSGEKITINGQIYTFGDGTGGTIAIGADLDESLDNLATRLNGTAPDLEVNSSSMPGTWTYDDTTKKLNWKSTGTISAAITSDSIKTSGGKSLALTYEATSANLKNHKLFVTTDGSDRFTADNIKISDDWLNGHIQIKKSADADAGSTASDNILRMLDALKKEREFTYDYTYKDSSGTAKSKSISFFTGSIEEFYADLENTQGTDSSSNKSVLTNHTAVLQETASNKDAVSGVSLDEEGIDLMKFQKSFSAAARLMTTLDEALDVLINKTGVVGR